MNSMNGHPHTQLMTAIHWVREELERSIAKARAVIDQHAESGGDPLELQSAFNELSQVRGGATMIRCHGLSAVAGEMAVAVQELIQGRIEDSEALYSALLGASIQIGDYIQALVDGMPDCVLVMQPAINELRLARGQPVLTESELFVSQMLASSSELQPPALAPEGEAIEVLAKRYQPVFEASLLAWIRNGADAQVAAGRVGKISELLSQRATLSPVYQLWRTAAAAIEAYLTQGLGTALELKRLFGRLGVQLKVLAEHGEAVASEKAADVSLPLLFIVGRSTSRGGRVAALRTQFYLDDVLPDTDKVETLRRRIHGPSSALLQKVADEIRADFTRVKDQIDLAVRTGGQGDLGVTEAGLRHIADILGMLGLRQLRRIVTDQADLVTATVESGQQPARWMDLATSILRVESSLEGALFRQMRRSAEDGEDHDKVSDKIPEPRDLRQGRDALYRESLVNLARVKTVLDGYFRNAGSSSPDLAVWLREIASGLDILDLPEASALNRRLLALVAEPELQRLKGEAGAAERLADAVAALEYFIEAVRAGTPGAAAILRRVEAALSALERTELVPEASVDVVLESPASDQADAAETPVDNDLTEAAVEPAEAAADTSSTEPAAGDDDPEIREIFLDEAVEVLQTLQSSLAVWKRDTQAQDALAVIRRSFHTLKGSGRMVGASVIGEFAWSIESLLNKCLEGSLQVGPPVVDVVEQAVALLPQLIEAFRERSTPPEAVDDLTRRAQAIAEGRDPDAGDEEPELETVFRDDAAEKFAAIEQWIVLDGSSRGVDREVVRAFHTIRGSARVVGATAVSQMAEAVESYLDACDAAHLWVESGAMQVLADVTAQMRRWVDALGTPAAESADAAPWLARLQALQVEVPEEAQQASTDRQLAEIFSMEALELVEKIEGLVRSWQSAPDSRRISADLKVVCHTLAGAALMSNCEPIGRAAKVLQYQFEGAQSTGLVPSDAAFTTLLRICEHLYQRLDEYREGRLGGNGDDLCAEIAGLGWALGDAKPPTVAETTTQVAGAVPASDSDPALDPALERFETADAAIDASDDMPEDASEVLGDATLDISGGDGAPIDGSELTLESEMMSVDLTESDVPATDDVAEALATSEFDDTASLSAPEVSVDGMDLGELPAEPTTPAAESSAHSLDTVAGEVIDEMPPVAEAPAMFGDDPDPEMLVVFQAECEELLEALDQATGAFERHSGDLEALAEIKRVLHTLKGSARVSGLRVLGDVAHALEDQFERLERGDLQPDSRFFARVQNVVDGLHLALDDLRRGLIPEPVQLLEDLEAEFAASQDASVAPQDLSVDMTAEVPAWEDTAALEIQPEPEPAAELESEAEPEIELATASETAVEVDAEPPTSLVSDPEQEAVSKPVEQTAQLPDDFDEELMQTFASEAEELMETLEHASAQWRAAPGDYTPARDMLRALHTLKGGARLSGLPLMGDAAHELESLIEGLEYARELNVDALRVVSSAVEQLRGMTDALLRGDYASLLQPAADDEPSYESLQALDDARGLEATPVAEETTVEPVAEAPASPVDASMIETAVDEPAADAPELASWDPSLFWRPEDATQDLAAQRRETARVSVESLDRMLNEAGEISIYRSRLEEHNASIQAQLDDLSQAITRVRDQLRQLDIETEAQIAARGLDQLDQQRDGGEFDPLEMDRYTRMQELSRALSESIGDVASVHGSLDQLASEATTILLQQGRINTEVQQGLMSTLMVPFSRQAGRLQRVVQQTAQENGKQVELAFDGIDAELDRNVLERMTAPLEHLLRNAVIHGIETPDARRGVDKRVVGRIAVTLHREGSQLAIELADDGKGLDLQAIRETAVRRGLMPEGAEISDAEAAQFIFVPGFSTARQLTQDAGRGVGMDVVASEVKQLGGTLEIASQPGQGTRFVVRLPLTLAISQSLLVSVGQEDYAVPLSSTIGVSRVPVSEVEALLASDSPGLEYGGERYRLMYLRDLVGVPRDASGSEGKTLHVIIVRMPDSFGGEQQRVAVLVDELIGTREIVSKAVGPQVSAIPGLSGATILADGRVVLILDVPALVQDQARRLLRARTAEDGVPAVAAPSVAERELIMVVDDSITIRRVTERLLGRQGYAVVTAKDGLDAMAQLQTVQPRAILLDIEMPRANGFEVATFVRNTPQIAQTPIIMITSRSGEKHRERAASIGVDRYLIKPYQEDQLMQELREVLAGSAA